MYIATDEQTTAIYGIGGSPEAAAADANRQAPQDEPREWVTYPASEALYRSVEQCGGAGLSWSLHGAVRTAVLDIELDTLLGLDDDPDAEPTEPEPGDYILAPAGPLGCNTAVSVVEGACLGTFDRNGGRYDSSEDWALAVIRERMNAESYYPNVWRQDDHGGYTLLTVEG